MISTGMLFAFCFQNPPNILIRSACRSEWRIIIGDLVKKKKKNTEEINGKWIWIIVSIMNWRWKKNTTQDNRWIIIMKSFDEIDDFEFARPRVIDIIIINFTSRFLFIISRCVHVVNKIYLFIENRILRNHYIIVLYIIININLKHF